MAAPESILSDVVAGVDTSKSAKYVREVTNGLIQTYAEVSGDIHPLHVDADYARGTPWGRCIAHGAMLVGFMSTASTILSEEIEAESGHANVSLGYDRLRFVEPVFAGDTITTTIAISKLQPEQARIICTETCVNQHGATVAVGTHVMRFI